MTQFDCNYRRYLQVTGDLNCHAEVNCDDGEHGFHVHEAAPIMQEDGTWDCAAAGGHFRKDGQEHGVQGSLNAPNQVVSHLTPVKGTPYLKYGVGHYLDFFCALCTVWRNWHVELYTVKLKVYTLSYSLQFIVYSH